MTETAPGPWQKGGPSPNPTGRRPLPAKLLSRSDDLLDFQLRAVFTGRIPIDRATPEDEQLDEDGNPVPSELTQEVPAKTRVELSDRLLDRVHGRPTAVVETTATTPAGSRLARLYRAADAIEAIEATAPKERGGS